jgi:hypothetical protein
MAGLLTGTNSLAQEPAFAPTEGPPYVGGPAEGPSFAGVFAGVVPPPCVSFPTFYVDYRIRRFGTAYTSYEFGDPDPAGANPLSQLKFPLNSTWNGVELGLEEPRWAVRAEWLTPFGRRIDGLLEDRDWLWQYAGLPLSAIPTDLGVTSQRWINGQTADVGLEIKLWEGRMGLPLSVWPVGGFRWQKFEIMAFDLTQLVGFDSRTYQFVPLVPPVPTAGDVIRFRQEYYHYYVGGQLRLDLEFPWLIPDIRLTFQGDWASVQAFNFDHHLLREGDFIIKEDTRGDAWHLGLSGEVLFTDHFTVGIEGEYTQIRTSGSHHFINEPLGIDQTWTRGVHVWSNQTAVTFFMRLRF